MRVTLLFAFLIALAAPAAADPTTRLRGSSPADYALIRHLLERSPTARELASELERSDVIAYVQLTHEELPGHAATRLVTATDRHRFVRIVLGRMTPPRDLMILLGHELQHVAEIVREPGVRDAAGLQQMYRRIGEDRNARFAFETTAARDVALRVRRELASGAVAPSPAAADLAQSFKGETGPDEPIWPGRSR